MKRILDFFWPLVGFAAVAVSLWLLHREFKGEAVGPEVWDHLKSVSPAHHLLAILSTLVAYGVLAWYDRIGLLHLGVKNISWVFISLCSFTTYAVAHNIGATVFSGGLVRYRAYRIGAIPQGGLDYQATSRIGQACAEHLASAGWRVLLEERAHV
jgi:glycosyltransferase 2 family protein